MVTVTGVEPARWVNTPAAVVPTANVSVPVPTTALEEA